MERRPNAEELEDRLKAATPDPDFKAAVRDLATKLRLIDEAYIAMNYDPTPENKAALARSIISGGNILQKHSAAIEAASEECCTYPDCGCDGAIHCMGKEPNNAAIALNLRNRPGRKL